MEHLRQGLPERVAAWLLALASLLPFAALAFLHRLPEGPHVALGGQWQYASQRAELAQASSSVRLPGALERQGVKGTEAWLRRELEVPAELARRDLFLLLGETRSSLVTVFINGQYAGEVGARGQVKLDFIALTGSDVPRGLVRAGTNVVELQVRWSVQNYEGIRDPRFLLGDADVFKPWFERTQANEQFLRLAPPLLCGFILFLLGALLAVEHRPETRRRYVSAALAVGGSILYQTGRTGILFGLVFDERTRLALVVLSVAFIVVGILDFLELELFGRSRWIGRVNRPLALLNSVGNAAFVFFAHKLPLVFSAYWLLVLLYMGGLSVWLLTRGTRGLRPLLGFSILTCVATGLLDSLGDLYLLSLPRLFATAINDMALIIGAVVVGDFLRTSELNRSLTDTLKTSNQELAAALSAAQAATRAKGQFLANVSHELRTPLNAIINLPEGLIEQFAATREAHCAQCQAAFELEPGEVTGPKVACPECGAEGSLDERQRRRFAGDGEAAVKLLGTVQRSGTHLLQLVEQVLDYSKLEAGKMQLAPAPVPLEPLFSDLVTTLRPLAEARGIELVPPPNAPPTVHADPVKLMQVLLNLGGNAIKFSPDRSAVRFGVQSDAQGVVFSVKDEGIGIAPEHRERIFQSFEQVHGGNTRRFGGTGLGLSITRELVRLHGGEVWLESELGKGSTFYVRFPASPATPREA